MKKAASCTTTSSCDLRILCDKLARLGAKADPDWLGLLLFARNLVAPMSILDARQKKAIQDMALSAMAAKDPSPARFRRALRGVEEILLDNQRTRDLEERLQAERKVVTAVLDELTSMLGDIRETEQQRQDRIQDLGEETIAEVLSGDDDREAVVHRIRSLLGEVLAGMREESRRWEEKARVLEHTASYDPLLTLLFNRRVFEERLEAAAAVAAATGRPLSMLMVDVDHFKVNVNDRYGHRVGDDVLLQIADILASHAASSSGIAARYGGEELSVICPGMDLEEAAFRAEAIRYDVAKHAFTSPGLPEDVASINVTVSVGVALLTPEMGPKELIAAADKALYRAKGEGRNLIATYSAEDALGS